MAKEALELIKKAERDAELTVEDAKNKAAQIVSSAKEERVRSLKELEEKLHNENETAKDAALQLAEEKAAAEKAAGSAKAEKIMADAERIAEEAKAEIIAELVR